MWRNFILGLLIIQKIGVCYLFDKCVMTQKCIHGKSIGGEPCVPEASDKYPSPMNGTGWYQEIGGGACITNDDCNRKGTCINGTCKCIHDGIIGGKNCEGVAIQCPQYRENACCSWQQNHLLASNFQIIASVFGHNRGGGCDACASNMMALWCAITCSPYQRDFLRLHSAKPSTNFFPDPLNSEKMTKVLELDAKLPSRLTCQLFDSCKFTSLASLTEAMKSALGFLKYQAQTGAIGHGEYIHLDFEIEKNGSFPVMLNCSNYSWVRTNMKSLPTQARLLPSIISNSTEKSCPCSSCQKTCNSDHGSVNIKIDENPISIMDGFSLDTVAFMYTIILIILGTIWFIRKRSIT